MIATVTKCHVCGFDCEGEVLTENAHGEKICSHCFMHNHDKCKGCGKLYPSDELFEGRCDDCQPQDEWYQDGREVYA